VVTFLVCIQVLPVYQAPSSAARRTFTSYALAAISLLILLTVLIGVVTDLDGFLTRANAERFLVAPALALAFIPLLHGIAWLTRREQATLRKRFHVASDVTA
jgi:hypothetical protein